MIFKPEDLGLTADMLYFRRMMVDGPQTISYLHLHERDKFLIGIFCFPPSDVIPLHNHPGMTIFSKLLFGTTHIKSYDWVVDDPSETSAGSTPICPPGARLAKVKVDSDFAAPCNTSILYPADGGNMHLLHWRDSLCRARCVGPSILQCRRTALTYYRDFSLASLSVGSVSVAEEDKGDYAQLEETEKPKDFTVVGATYRGSRSTKK